MNMKTGNGMGLKPKGMGLKASQGMGIKTSKGMGLTTSKGMGLASEKNYFNFNEYERKKRYFFGDRGKGKPSTKIVPPQTSRPVGSQPPAHTTKPQVYQAKAPLQNPAQQDRRRAEPPRQRGREPEGRVVKETKVVPVVQDWQPVTRSGQHAPRVAVPCDCFYCQMDQLRDIRW